MDTADRRADLSGVRVQFKDFQLQELSDDRCSARVVLAWQSGDEFVGSAETENSPRGQLRAAAEATAHALEAATDGRVGLTVLSVHALETLETVLVVVSLSSHVDDRSERLVGSCLIKDIPARGAALAVLNATNRLLSIYLQ